MASTVLSPETLSDSEYLRQKSLVKLMGSGGTAIDIGAGSGQYARLIRERYDTVVALDLYFAHLIPDVECAFGDVRRLQFPDHFFDLVFCAGVLEHVPNVKLAAQEIARVCRGRAVIGVPYRQDLRLGRLTCDHCRRINPPYGHINSFNEDGLRELFSWLMLEHLDYVGEIRAQTNRLSTWLLDRAGNPYGPYDQREPCLYCGARFVAPDKRSALQKIAGRLGLELIEMQREIMDPQPIWMHAVFRR